MIVYCDDQMPLVWSEASTCKTGCYGVFGCVQGETNDIFSRIRPVGAEAPRSDVDPV